MGKATKDIFTSVVKGKNFITPEVVRYQQQGDYAVELSKGDFCNDTIYGVTVVHIPTERKVDKLCRSFYGYSEANDYINDLEKQTMFDEIEEDDIRPVKDRELINGTSYVGILNATFDSMVQVFGAPQYWGGDKTQCEWELRTPEGVATIYDWKEYRKPRDVTQWHVGGHNSVVADYLAEYYNKFAKRI